MNSDASTDADLRALQAERLPLALARAQAKTEGLDRDGTAGALLQAAQRARTSAQRVVWLQRAATAWGRPFEAVAACRKGCAHCCRIPVTISRQEAEVIGRAAGRRVESPRHTIRLLELDDTLAVASAEAALQHSRAGQACPLLVDDACAIYAHRPLVCRALFNLDDDDLLCRHSDAGQAEVPYADSRALRALALAAQPTAEFADIRDFFPPAPEC